MSLGQLKKGKAWQLLVMVVDANKFGNYQYSFSSTS